jgi:signal peptidase I
MRRALDWILTLAVAVGFVLVFEAEVAKPYRIPSDSMEPTLHCARPARGCTAHFSDRVVALRIVYRFRAPQRGDIVVFQAPAAAASACGQGGTFVKRIVGLPGEVVSEHVGKVAIDGKPLREPYVHRGRRDLRSGRWRVPEGSYFMMGDNRAGSCDSRDWGPVPRGSLIGPADVTYWPPSRVSLR